MPLALSLTDQLNMPSPVTCLQTFDSLLATGLGHRSRCQGQRSAQEGSQVVKSEPEVVHRVPWMLGAGLTCLWRSGPYRSLQAARRSPAGSVTGGVEKNQAYHGTTLVESSSVQQAAPHGSSPASLCRHLPEALGLLGCGQGHRSVRSHCRSAPQGPAGKRRPSVAAALPWQQPRQADKRSSSPQAERQAKCAASPVASPVRS